MIYDVAIVGGGVTGTALLDVSSRYTNVGPMLLIEQYPGVAMVNSNPMNNAQTSHDGSTETNYDLPHALQHVKGPAMLLRHYVEKYNVPGLFRKTNRMVIGVGAHEVELLTDRFNTFSPYYPDLRLIGPRDLEDEEPMVMKGRDPEEPICALVSSEGYAINYQKLSEVYLENALASGKKIDVRFNTKVLDIRKANGVYEVGTTDRMVRARVVVFAAGAYSLLFAQKMGYGKEYAILNVAGSFFSAGKFLNGKVYTVQIEGLPFAAPHGDPDVLNPDDTRFGPTTKPLPLMIRHRYDTVLDYFRIVAHLRTIPAFTKLMWDRQLLGYVVKNWIFDLPFVGKELFLKEARKIVPTIRYGDLKLRRGAGGIRPQLVDTRTGKLVMGDASMVGDNVIFNTTPSPGASVSLGNAVRDAERIVNFLGTRYNRFDRDALYRDLNLPLPKSVAAVS